MSEGNFCIVVQEFICAVILLLQTIKQPSIDSCERIGNLTTRTSKNDKGIRILSEFIAVLDKILYNIHDVVLNMKIVFITSSEKSIERLIQSLTQFLVFLHTDQVLERLQSFQLEFEKVKLETLTSIQRISSIVCHICSVSIDLTTLFLPAMFPAAILVEGLRMYIENIIDDRERDVYVKHNIDKIIESLLHIQLETESLAESFKLVQTCIGDKNSDIITKDLVQIQDEYLDLKRIHLDIRSKISKYSDLQKAFLYKCSSVFR